MPMNNGKVTENILKRSVLKNLKSVNEKVLVHPSVAGDSSVVNFDEYNRLVISTNPVTYTNCNMGALAVNNIVNDLAASGCDPIGIMVNIIMPSESEEVELKSIIKELDAEASKYGMEVLGGHTEVSDAVNRTIITITGIGGSNDEIAKASNAKADMDIVVTKWIGLEGTIILLMEHEEELKDRFSMHFVEETKALGECLSVLKEGNIAISMGATSMHNLSKGGILGGLWEMASAANLGLTVDMERLPLKQETVEICEFLNINPYELTSNGAMLIATNDGNGLVSKLNMEGIEATVIGRFNDSNDRIIINEGETRYLDMPKCDEIYKL